MLCFGSIISYNTSVNNWIMKRRKQNHKISFHFFSGSPHTPRRKWIGKEIFGFVHATAGSVRGAQGWRWQALRAYDLGRSHHALGACVSRQNPADFARTMFELRPKNTAKQGARCTSIGRLCFCESKEGFEPKRQGPNLNEVRIG